MDSPFFIFFLTLTLLTLFTRLGIWLQKHFSTHDDHVHTDLNIVRTLNLTLLGLIIGFSFSMAIPRYDERRSVEDGEARAIASAYNRADLLTAQDAAQIRPLLLTYLNQRINFYLFVDPTQLAKLSSETDKTQQQLWDAVRVPGTAQPNSITALAVSSVDDVIGSRVTAEAAWRKRVPMGVWVFLVTIACFASMLTGIGARRPDSKLHYLLPLLIAIAFYQIGDIENPRIGFISVLPENLQHLSQTLHNR